MDPLRGLFSLAIEFVIKRNKWISAAELIGQVYQAILTMSSNRLSQPPPWLSFYAKSDPTTPIKPTRGVLLDIKLGLASGILVPESVREFLIAVDVEVIGDYSIISTGSTAYHIGDIDREDPHFVECDFSGEVITVRLPALPKETRLHLFLKSKAVFQPIGAFAVYAADLMEKEDTWLFECDKVPVGTLSVYATPS